MNCTAFGLIVAIIGLVGFAVLNGKTQALEDDINESSVQVLNLVVHESPEGQHGGAPDGLIRGERCETVELREGLRGASRLWAWHFGGKRPRGSFARSSRSWVA